MPYKEPSDRTEYVNRWRAENPERFKEHQRRYLEKLLADPVRLARKKMLDAAREKTPRVKAKRRAYVIAHPEVGRRIMRNFYRREPWSMLYARAADRCKKSGREFTITREWAKANWTGKCALTGITFTIGDGEPVATSPSLDRIDASRGYLPDNCRFVLWAINRFKGNGTDEEMMAIARAMVRGA